MKIALLGASGRVGQRITMEALVRGHEVKALVRNPERFPIAHPRLTVAHVDIFDPASVAEAITDSDVVVNATPTRCATRSTCSQALDFWNQNGQEECRLLWRYSCLKD